MSRCTDWATSSSPVNRLSLSTSCACRCPHLVGCMSSTSCRRGLTSQQLKLSTFSRQDVLRRSDWRHLQSCSQIWVTP